MEGGECEGERGDGEGEREWKGESEGEREWRE